MHVAAVRCEGRHFVILYACAQVVSFPNQILIIIIIIIILMTREAGVAYKSIKYELCILKAEYTNLANEFTTTVFFDVNK